MRLSLTSFSHKVWVQKEMKSLITIALALMLTGCSTISYRVADNRIGVRPGLYPATRLDSKCAANAKRGGGWMMENPDYLMATLFYLDMPVSFLTDTLAIAWDIASARKYRVWENFLAGQTGGISPEILRATYTDYGDTIAYHKLHYQEEMSHSQLTTLALADIQPAEIADRQDLTADIALIVSSNHPGDRLIQLKLKSNRSLTMSTQQEARPYGSPAAGSPSGQP